MTRLRRAVAALVLAASSASARAGDPADAAQRARGVVNRVFSEPEFSPLAEADKIPRLVPESAMSWLERVSRWLEEVLRSMARALVDVLRWLFGGLRRLFGGGSGGGAASGEIARIVAWAVGVAAVALVVWLIVRLVRASAQERRARASATVVPAADVGDDDALARSPDEWRRAATEFADGGRGREAVRALYLSLLSALHHAGAIDYDRTRTNTAYVGDVAAGHPARAPFVSITSRFDVAWYGRREPSAAELDAATAESDSVLRAFAKERTRV